MTAPSQLRLMPTSWTELRALLKAPLDELSLAQSFARYFVVGGLSFAVYFVLFTVAFYLGLHYTAAGASAFVVATWFNYMLSIRFVFASGHHSRGREVALTYLVSGLGLLINQAVLAGLVELAGLHPLIAACGATVVVFAWNFTARHLWVFPA